MTRVVSLLLAVVMVLSMAVLPASAAGFRDVTTDAWYAEAVDYVTARGYMAGTGEDTFAPNAAVTRAMFVTVLAKMAGAETDNNVHPFEDVPAGTWYSGAVAWAAEQGIVCGTGAGKFSPEKNITRQDMSLILANFVMAIGYKLPQEEQKTFADADKISAYAREAVAFGTGAGLMSGYSDGTFRPTATATRAQLAVIVMALDKKIQGLDAEPVPMPAQSFEKTASGISVGVKAPVGAVPAGTELELSRVTDDAYLNDIGARTGTGVIGAVDISFLKDGVELEPERAVEVEISMPGLEAVQNPALIHVRDDGSLELVSGVEKVNGTKGGTSLKFAAKDFSVYVFVEGGSEQMLTINFYKNEGDTTPINVQVIRLSQLPKYESQNIPYVYDPGVPEITNTQSFEGWKALDYSGDEKKENLSVDEINTYIDTNYDTSSTGGTLRYYAMIYEVRYVVYHDQAGAVLTSQAFHVTKTGETVDPTNVKIDWTYVGFKGEQNFAGWVAKDKVDVAGDYPLYKDSLNTAEAPTGDVYKNGATYTLSDTLLLYPYLNTGHWLVFDTYKDQTPNDLTSTSYIGPVFYEEGKNTVAPAVPTRTGYEFKGWFKDKQFTNRFIFGSPISEDTTVYAKWEAKNTTYQVIFWQQNPTDAVDAADSAKTYSFYKSDVRTATTGQSVSINTASSGTTADNRLGGNDASNIGEMGFYFSYNGTNSDTASAVVKGDGSTVLNVYYDRKVITYNFYGDLTSYSYSSSSYNANYAYYGYSNGYFRVYRSGSRWYDASDTRYTGTVYHLTFDTDTLSNNSADVQFGSIQGLYGSTMDYFDWSSASTTISGNDWPFSGEYLMWHDATTGRYLNKMFQYTTGEATTSTTIDYYLNEYEVSSTTRPVTCLGQDTDGNFTITLDELGLKSTETLYYAGDEYFGYELDRYNKTANNYNSATQWDGGRVTCSYSDIGSNGHAYFYYKRNQWNFVYESNNSQVKTESVYWEKSLSDLAGYVPTNGPEGYYFDGWFADPGFDTEFDFTQEMPNHAVQIYAKWTVERFRIVLDPTGGEQGVDPSDITFPGNQATTFRVDYGELVQASSINNGQREGYTLLGWFLDKEYTKPFNFANPVTDAIADMTYADASDAERQGVDPWTLEDGEPTPYTDVGRDNVRGKVTIYAHWRQDPDGVIGVNVHYLATDKEGNTGKFLSNNSTEWDDPNIYADQAMAFGQPASKPDNDTSLQFLYWEILGKDGSVVGKAYPGQLWTVDFKNAVEETLSASDSETETNITAPKDDAEPSRSFHPGEIVHPTAETMTVYAPVDTIETGTDYLIGVTASNGTTYLLMSYNPSTGTYYGSASLSGYTTDRLSYAIPAVLDENGNVTGVDASGISGATLAHVEWIFNSTSNGKYSIQSGYNSSYYLRVGDDGSTTNLNLYPASYSSGYGATWVWDSSTHRLSHYYSSSYYRLYLAMLTVGGVPTYFDVDYDTDYARTVQLYKKTTIEVGPTMHTVTFMDGYNNTKIADVEVEDGGAATAPDAPDHSAQGMIFNGWDTAFDNITEDITVTAQYVDKSTLTYTVTFRYMDSEGNWIETSQTVNHGSAATPPTVPTPPTGYTFNSWDKKYNNITSNLTINAVYKQVATKKYVVTLRAVYGRSSLDAVTHIYWYANNGTEYHNKGGERYEQLNLEINRGYMIPTPATWEGDKGGTLINRGRKFLGWARVQNTGSGEEGSDQSALTADDLWLVYDEASGKFTVNTANDPEYTGAADGITQVAADEMKPYHDLYAVWGPSSLFYVFHSATGKLEAIDVNAVKGTAGTGTYDLTSVVTPGYLYGGYYKQYGYITATQMQTVVDKFENGGALTNTGWTEYTTVVNNVLAVYTPKDADGFTKYTGASFTNGTDKAYTIVNGQIETGPDGKPKLYAPVWVNAQAYKEANGEAKGSSLVPEAGKVYYLKEVPESYLTSRIAWTYDTVQKGKVIDVFLLSVFDDNNYSDYGFYYVDEVSGEKLSPEYKEDGAPVRQRTTDKHLAKTFSLVTKPADGGEQLDPVVIDAPTFGVTYGNIAVSRQTAFAEADAFSMLPTWTTLDGVEVTNDPVAFTRKDNYGGEGENTYGGFGWQRVYDGNETIYVDTSKASGLGNAWWDDGSSVVRIRFKNDSSKTAWITMTVAAYEQSYHILAATVPCGDWTHVQLYRENPQGANSTWHNRTGWMTIPNAESSQNANISANCISEYYKYDGYDYEDDDYEDNDTGTTDSSWSIYPAVGLAPSGTP